MNRARYEQLQQQYGYKPSPASGDRPFVGVRIDGDVVYVSGNVAFSGGELLYKGRIGDTVSIEDGKKSAALAMLNCLAAIDAEIGLEQVDKFLKVTGFVCCAEHVTEQPQIMNAASQVLVDVFGEAGKHARSALGIHTLPLGASVEIELILKRKPEASR
jgi:enamine deaminase RidA (YjgF/YER057c/UK114 family)